MVSGCSFKLSVGNLSRELVVLIMMLTFVSLARGELIDRVIANVGGEPVLESEAKLAGLLFGIKDREAIFRALVEKHAIALFLRGKGFKIPEDYIDKVIEDIARNNNKTTAQLYKELYQEGFIPDDFRHLVEIEVASTLLFREYLSREIEVSDIEIELERLRKGEVEFLKEIKLLVIPSDKRERVMELIERVGDDLDSIATEVGLKPEVLKVKRGELLEPLDREIWRYRSGLAVAEDGENLYLAKVLRTVRVFKGRSEDEIREEIFMNKLKEKEREMITEIKKQIFIEMFF